MRRELGPGASALRPARLPWGCSCLALDRSAHSWLLPVFVLSVSLTIELIEQSSSSQDNRPRACDVLAFGCHRHDCRPRCLPFPFPLSHSCRLRKAVSCAPVPPTWGSGPGRPAPPRLAREKHVCGLPLQLHGPLSRVSSAGGAPEGAVVGFAAAAAAACCRSAVTMPCCGFDLGSRRLDALT